MEDYIEETRDEIFEDGWGKVNILLNKGEEIPLFYLVTVFSIQNFVHF